MTSPSLFVLQSIIAIACHLDPTATAPRANGYDCAVSHAVRRGSVSLPDDADENERLLRRNRALYNLSRRAEAACGSDCRFFYGGFGDQCLAVAQSPYFTGLGSFMGRESTQRDAERTALRDCEEFVGQPGQSCNIIVSVCTESL